ncbi:hypothetical protein L1987_30278 [Smallanthus sonchifolius]|uniref:Uncharacterized protein n=1 Tax=Smallanthus sonchifolius TaxID=185202 RepID=A0ACB9I3W4_9ASTR|nr:hypothetical protein L1987_30278 [Smallanthus sonchifolius]
MVLRDYFRSFSSKTVIHYKTSSYYPPLFSYPKSYTNFTLPSWFNQNLDKKSNFPVQSHHQTLQFDHLCRILTKMTPVGSSKKSSEI